MLGPYRIIRNPILFVYSYLIILSILLDAAFGLQLKYHPPIGLPPNMALQ